jgi:hypothetical protein
LVIGVVNIGRWSLVAGRWSLVAGRWFGFIRAPLARRCREEINSFWTQLPGLAALGGRGGFGRAFPVMCELVGGGW